ncbi:MAG TPA: peroxidase family protein, partial [Microlunatus sp.]
MSTAHPAWSKGRHLLSRATEWVDHKIGWHRLPTPLGLLVLVGVRDTLREQNLYDTEAGTDPTPPPADASVTIRRTVDGTYNDLDHPMMGSAGRRFGRNVNPAHAQ